jgi:hypothetical protein
MILILFRVAEGFCRLSKAHIVRIVLITIVQYTTVYTIGAQW